MLLCTLIEFLFFHSLNPTINIIMENKKNILNISENLICKKN